MTDDNNWGILPGPDGIFNPSDLVSGGQYEVHGEGGGEGWPSWQGQNRFTFRRQPSAPSASASSASASTPGYVQTTWAKVYAKVSVQSAWSNLMQK